MPALTVPKGCNYDAIVFNVMYLKVLKKLSCLKKIIETCQSLNVVN